MAILTNDALVDGLETIGIKVSKATDKEISAHCPFHRDNHPSFSMSARTGVWICYQCGESGSLRKLFRLLSKDEDVDPSMFLREAAYQNALRSFGIVREQKDTTAQMSAIRLYAEYDTMTSPPGWALKSRRLDRECAQRFGLRWSHGWVIPIWGPESIEDMYNLWGWQFKRLQLVSNFPTGISKSKTLFGLRELEDTRIALVESPLDVCRLAMCDVPAVASFGAYVSHAQVQLLIERAETVLLALDNDTEGHKQTDKLYPIFARQVATTVVEYPNLCKDPGDLSNEQVLEVFT